MAKAKKTLKENLLVPDVRQGDLTREIATRAAAFDFSAWLNILPDPDPVLMKMEEDAQILKSLEADSQVTSEIIKRKSATKKRDWEIMTGQPAGKEPTPIEAKLRDWFQEDLEDLDVKSVITQILDAPLYGMVPIELIWSAVPGRLKLKEIRPVPFRWFGYDSENRLRFKGENQVLGELVPENKFVVARNEPTYENPYGKRLLSRVFWPVLFKKNGLKFWATFIERYGMPWAVGRYADKSQVPDMLTALTRMVRDAVAVLPKGSELDIKENNSTASSEIFQEFKREMDKDISKVICGQTLTSDSDKGTQALGIVHHKVLEEIQFDDANLVESTLNEIAWCFTQVNGGDSYCPVFKFHVEEDFQKDRAERDSKLAATNQIKFKKQYWVNAYNFKEDEIEEAGAASPDQGLPPAQMISAPAEGARGKQPANFAEMPSQEEIDALLKSIPDGELKGIAAKPVEDAMKMIAQAKSYEDILELLSEDNPEMDVDALQEVLARAIFVSTVWGRMNGKK